MSVILLLYNISKLLSKLVALQLVLLCLGVNSGWAAWNDPYPVDQTEESVFYSSFSERPKHLDPVRAYSSDEYKFLAQIYEPPLQYHFLLRPYSLVPLTAETMPSVRYVDHDGAGLPEDAPADDVAFSEYEFTIKQGVRFQLHPAFARDGSGEHLYHDLPLEKIQGIQSLDDFEQHDSREVTAEDFVHQIKRIADPKSHSPIAGVMAQYIVGFEDLSSRLKRVRGDTRDDFIDLRDYPLSGAQVIDRYRYRVQIKGKYPQFIFWQAMPFFAPMPWEAVKFYSQQGLEQKNISLDWYPVGTGPFYLVENNPNLRMVMVKSPTFHGEEYPEIGMPGDKAAGLLRDAGKQLPFIGRAVYSLEKEAIPRWNKFLQGYYDNSGINSDSFDQAVQLDNQGGASLTGEMQHRGIELSTSVQTSMYYMGFNMLDEVIGGTTDQSRKLRRAISIAMDFEEFVSIFTNGRGIPAQGPIPPGIFGARSNREGINPYVYDWSEGKAVRKPISAALELLKEAGYENGIDQSTGNPLSLNFEAVTRGPDDKARLNWIRKQFDKLGIQLVIRATDYNRFREKMLKGTGELFFWGWNADYPDPENFLFLLYGPNSKALHGGENASNYQNPEFDQLFEKMKNMENGPARQVLIDRMVDIVRRDAPWLWGFHPKAFSLHHSWLRNIKPNLMANNTLKYWRVDPVTRKQMRTEWNPPIWWPLILGLGIFALSAVPAVIGYRRRQRVTVL